MLDIVIISFKVNYGDSMTDIQEIKTYIGEMDKTDFVNFQRELQYGVTWHNVIGTKANNIFSGTGEDRLTRTDNTIANECHYHMTRANEIADSDLYAIVRQESEKRGHGTMEGETRCAWIDFDQKDVDKINGAITDIFRLEIYGTPNNDTQKEELKNAKTTIEETYGLKGIFTINQDLNDIFVSTYMKAS